MGTLTELGLNEGAGQLSLVNAPDTVLAEAGAMKPRPAFASTLSVAQPRPRIAWWPERRLLAPAPLSRLAWLLVSAQGRAWLVFDPEDGGECLTAAEVRAALETAGLRVVAQRRLGTGELALAATT